ncbi:lipoprotein [Youhaiella tibetensis]|uniref:DUF1684 domain-containing protein n=1 Tax=Paradevosia tibetensis TaxID=1447062 RepID=A0A5B9DKM2_9HYPH|nr:DUF1684 domain-containing protein [Youhaiella tibetensis]QEE19693.1 DUF1684 domain-containing protein [Youhaiella tibetensis]GGF30815.1 lipoprotein [Youhaiella tibetensis]
MTDYLTQLDAWKAHRLERLKAADGWLNVIGRYWLENGTVSVGSAHDNDLVLSAGPAHVGTVTQDAEGVTFTPAEGIEGHENGPVRLKLDKHHPPRFHAGSLLLEVTTLNGQHALRVRDSASTAPADFPGIPYYPADPSWRIVADWQLLDTPITMTVDTVLGIPTEVTVTHKAVFQHDGQTYEIIATHGSAKSPQFVIKDPTSRTDTYPASRFLFGEDVTDSSIVLDFNKAINPPCAFTEHAVCPLPPPENVLPFAITAGEKRIANSH